MSRADTEPRSRWTLANALTLFRLAVAAPLMLVLAVAGQHELFVWLLLASFISDAIDGTIARLGGQATPFGALLDSWADVAAYCAIAISVALLWPQLVLREWLPFAAIVISFIAPSLVGLIKYGRFTSYHTYLVKIAVAATAVGLLLLLSAGPAWPFRLAAGLAVLAALEEIGITMLLPAPRSDVRGLLAVWRWQRGRDARQPDA